MTSIKNMKIVIREDLFDELRHQLNWDGKEKITYMLCHRSRYKNRLKLMPHSFVIPEEKDYLHRSSGYLKVKKEFVSIVFNEAVQKQSDVIQIHIHPPGAGGKFSAVDKHDEPILMRHVSEHINGIIHASMVFSHDFSELDSYFYDRSMDHVIPVEKVLIQGKNRMQLFIPKSIRAEKEISSPYLDRTIKAFGRDAVQMLRNLDIGIIGASALGGPVIEMAARDQFGSILICDPDIIDESNLNRLRGASPGDVNKSKAEFYYQYAKMINPDLQVRYFQESFYNEEVQKAYSQSDIIIGCVDSGARFSINRLSLANLIPYFDLGAIISKEKEIVDYKGGQVFSILPGRSVCLECSGVFRNLKSEFWSEEKKRSEKKQGYLPDENINPLVAHLDDVIAGFGYHEMLNYIWGQQTDDHFALYCNMSKNSLMVSKSSSEGCIFCQNSGCLGMGDKIEFLVPEDTIQPDQDFPKIY